MTKMTQNRKSVLDWQIANRRADSHILDLAHNLMQPTLKPSTPIDNSLVRHGISHLGAKGQFILR